MVAVKRRERSQLHPTAAQFLVRVAIYMFSSERAQRCKSLTLTETAGVGPDHRDLEKLELQHTLDAEVHELPLAEVITELRQ